jgi:hypothetical protein
MKKPRLLRDSPVVLLAGRHIGGQVTQSPHLEWLESRDPGESLDLSPSQSDLRVSLEHASPDTDPFDVAQGNHCRPGFASLVKVHDVVHIEIAAGQPRS